MLAVVLGMTACATDKSKLVGKWEMEYYVIDQQIHDGNRTIEFNEDGTLKLRKGFDRYTGTWKITQDLGIVDIDYGGKDYLPYSYEFKDGYFILTFKNPSDNQVIAYYKKEK